MAPSISNLAWCASAALLSLFTTSAVADTLTLDWNVTWVTRNPDGLAERPVMGINGQWPIPMVNITKGDQVVINLYNALGNESTSVHFHGLFQNGTNEMDGPVAVTQCDIPPGLTMTYNFTIDQPGTYWYHSHTRAQYPDGFRGQFVVHDPENPYAGKYDVEVPLTVSDWYHDRMPDLMKTFVSLTNPTGAEPVPNSALMNDTQNMSIPFTPGTTYFFRLTNIGAFASQYFWIEGHKMTIIEVDGVYTEPAEANMIYLGVAQRYGFLVTALNSTSANFPITSSMDTTLFDILPDGLNWNVTSWIVYDDSKPKDLAPIVEGDFQPYDDFNLVPLDGEEIFDHVDYSISLDLTMDNLGNGASYAFFNGHSWVAPKVPTLYSALTTGGNATNAMVYGTDTNAYVLKKNDIVEIVLNNDDSGRHPFHLHGHNFQTVVRSVDNWGHYDPNNHTAFPTKPMRRDTLVVYPQGNFVIRFRADNPGIWLFHCHIEWHLSTGLIATMVEAPTELQNSLTIPQNHINICKAAGTPYQGNAAGNTENALDLTGENTMVKPLPGGFTARGIVALVFSCVAAFLGMAVIAWYGVAPLSAAEMAQTRRFVAKAGGNAAN